MAVLAPVSCLLVYAAGWLDPGHDFTSDYVSWLSDGPHWALAFAGLAGLGLSCALEARHVQSVLPPGAARTAAATSLSCTAALAAATILLPSRGVGEPQWRTAAHVGLAVGAYIGILGAAFLLAWMQRKHGLAGPRMAPWAAAAMAVLLALGVASAEARLGVLGSGLDLRGLAQMALLGMAALWLAMASRLRQEAASAAGPAVGSGT